MRIFTCLRGVINLGEYLKSIQESGQYPMGHFHQSYLKGVNRKCFEQLFVLVILIALNELLGPLLVRLSIDFWDILMVGRADDIFQPAVDKGGEVVVGGEDSRARSNDIGD